MQATVRLRTSHSINVAGASLRLVVFQKLSRLQGLSEKCPFWHFAMWLALEGQRFNVSAGIFQQPENYLDPRQCILRHLVHGSTSSKYGSGTVPYPRRARLTYFPPNVCCFRRQNHTTASMADHPDSPCKEAPRRRRELGRWYVGFTLGQSWVSLSSALGSTLGLARIQFHLRLNLRAGTVTDQATSREPQVVKQRAQILRSLQYPERAQISHSEPTSLVLYA